MTRKTIQRSALPWMMIALFLLPGNSFCQEVQPDTAANPLSLEVLTICRSVVDRIPLGSASEYSVGIGKLYCFTKVVGARTDTKIVHNWYRNGKLKARVELPVQSASWRTWSLKEIQAADAGDWMVEVLNEHGEPIESILFFIK